MTTIDLEGQDIGLLHMALIDAGHALDRYEQQFAEEPRTEARDHLRDRYGREAAAIDWLANATWELL